MKAPVLLIGFKRSSLASRVAEEISKSGGRRIYVALDGPRSDSEVPDCEKTYKMLKEALPEAIFNRSDINMGCGRRVRTAIDWVFEFEQSIIVLEDDCLPSENFFKFCDLSLEKFEDHSDISFISGCNLVEVDKSRPEVFLSKFGGIWGLATWKCVPALLFAFQNCTMC